MAFTEVDEKLLVRAYQAGDERAFDTIVRTQWKALYSHAVKRLSDHDAAEDAVQDTLLRAYRALPNLDGDLALRAWLHRILTNVCYDEGNRRRRRLLLDEKVLAQPEEVVPDAAEEAVLHDTVRVMSEALKDLPDTYREALVLRYVDGLSFREVAEATGTTEQNARARVHRGRQALHKVLAKVLVVAAFVIPGLKRGQHAPAAETAAPDTGVSLVAQLTSHAAQAAPAVTNMATQVSMMPGGKSALVTGAVAAAAAITVPVAAYTVNEVRQPEEKRPAATAAPFETRTTTTIGEIVDRAVAAVESTTTTSSAPATTSTLPPSAERPFDVHPGDASGEPTSETTSTTTPAPATEPQPAEEEPEPQPTITGLLATDELTATANGVDFDLDGSLTLPDGRSAELSGRLYLHDGQVKAEALRIVVDGVEHTLKFRAPQVERVTADDGSSEYRFTGKFALDDGTALGLPDDGEIVHGSFRDGGDAGLSLDLEGPAPKDS